MKPTDLPRRRFLRLAVASALTAPTLVRAAEPIRVGFLGPLSGVLGRVAETNRNCLAIALDEINAAGGLLGRRVELVTEDSQMSVMVSLDKARKMISRDGVSMIIGTVIPFEREAALQAAAQRQVMVIHPNLDEGRCHPQLLTTGQAPNQRIDPVIDWATRNIGKTMIIMASDLGTNRQVLVPQLEAAMKRHGGAVLSVRYVPFGMVDYGPVLQQVRAQAPDMVWHSITDDPLTFFKQYRSFGMKPQLVTDIVHESIAAATRGAAIGTIGVTSYMMSLSNAENRKFLDSYTARYPKSTTLRVGGKVVMMPMGESAYTGARLYAQAVNLAQSTDVARVKTAMQGMTLDAPRGKTQVGAGATHLLSPSFVARVGEDSSLELLSTYDPIAVCCQTS